MSADHAWITAQSILKSVWVTFLALSIGALVQSVTDGARSPVAFIGWCRDGHLYGYMVTQVVAPTIRGYMTFLGAKKAA